ncbi:AAA family ATPase, partial [Roseomonas terrae]
MKITALRLFNVKRFAGRGVAIEGIGDGVNVLCAANEFGKSTSFEALHALFFQPHSGTPGDVQRLRPYSGGSPLLEADIAVGDACYRITKQYYGGRSAQVSDLATGRMIAQADEAERFIADLTKGGVNGPGGLLWVRQGITGLEKRGKAEEDGERQVRLGLLESVQGEVEAVTGGRRMGGIMAATNDALGELVTAMGRPKAGGRYAAAIEARDRLRADERRLAAEVALLREALTERASAVRRLAEIDRPEDRAERRKAIEAAEAAFEAARAQREALKAAEAQLALVRERRDRALREVEVFGEALTAARELRERQREADRRRGEAVARRDAAAASIDAARKEVAAAEAAEQAARELVAKFDVATKAREAAERLDELRKLLTEAETVESAIGKAKARLAIEKLPAKAIDELEMLEVEIAKQRAIDETARPTVAIAYSPEAGHRILMDGAPLEADEARSYDELAVLAIPGVGTMTLRSHRPAKRTDRLGELEGKRSTLLSSMGLDSLAAAKKRQLDGQRLEVELKGLGDRLALLAPEGLAKLREGVAHQEAHATAESIELDADPAAVRGALSEAEQRRDAARLALREAEPLKDGADAAFVNAQTVLAELNAAWA